MRRTFFYHLRRKQGFHFATCSIGGEALVDGHVVPLERLALSHRAHQLDVVSEAQRQTTEGERRGRRQELAPDRVSAFAVEQLAGRKVPFGGRHHVGVEATGYAGRFAAKSD